MSLELREVTKRFDDVVAVRELALEVPAGEFLTLLGPSGCGKTTALRLIAGFESPDAGSVVFDGRDVTRDSPQRRGFGMVFQNYALFPHLDVGENVSYGLRARRASAAEIADRVAASLRRVNLEGYGARAVQALSGGQQQRVALARALAIEPPLLLLDEPLSNLDAALREQTRRELRDLVKGLGITAVFVTHDQEEAFALSDRIAVLETGRLRQIGPPEELYRRPADPFVATFVGRANLVPATLSESRPRRVDFGGEGSWAADADDDTPSGPVLALLRPEDLELTGAGAGLPGVVRDRRFAGATTSFVLRMGGSDGPRDLEVIAEDRARVGDAVTVRPREGGTIRVFPMPAGAGR